MTIARRPVGSTGLSLPEIGFGAAPLGNLYAAISDADARATLDAALAAGLRYVDTAPHYGRGLSERRVGDALRLLPDATVSTKVGRLMLPDPSVTDDRARDGFNSPMPFVMHYDYSHDGILRSYEHSLQRLGLARIDILYVHDIGEATHGAAAAHYWEQLTTGGGFAALTRLREERAISGFGLGVNEVAVCLNALDVASLDVILLAGRYTLLEQGALDALLPRCAVTGTSIVIGGPYNSGILATGTRGSGPAHYDYFPAPADILTSVRAIEDIADRYSVSLPAAALRFVLAHPQVVSVIPGLADRDRVVQTVDLYHQSIPADFWRELTASGLVRADAPLPTRRTGQLSAR